MQFDPSDIVFLVVVLWIAVLLINNSGGGGGHRARVPVPVRTECLFSLATRQCKTACPRRSSSAEAWPALRGGGAGTIRVLRSTCSKLARFLGGRATSYPFPATIPKSSTIASTSCCAAASISWIFIGGWASPTNPVSQAVLLHRARRPDFDARSRAFAGAAAFHRKLSEAGVSRASRQARDRPRAAGDPPRTRPAQGSRSHHDARLAARKAPDRRRAISRFWSQVLVSAINEELDRMAAATVFRCSGWDFWRARIPMKWGFRRCRWAICTARCLARIGNVRLHLRAPVERVIAEDGRVRGVHGGRRTEHGRLLYLARCRSSASRR